MQETSRHLRRATLMLFCVASAVAAHASFAATGPAAITVAVQSGECKAAIDLVNKGAADKDARSVFLGGRMQDEGGCVDVNREAAAHYFEAAATLGDAQAMLEYAGTIGLGIGAPQSYERAGSLCRLAGLDKNNKFNDYTLGFVCTVTAEAGRRARLAFSPGDLATSGANAHIRFSAADSSVHILSTPHILNREEAGTGSHIRRPKLNVDDIVEGAIHHALSDMPKADAAKLSAEPVELVIDLDMSVRINPGDAESLGGYLNDPRIQMHNAGTSMTSGHGPAN